eukprot:GHVQ01034230.1.p1 GENE.GHVQ01034230.1~~GHVQ01034230.1.p1  ORF type:complete len:296 (+),score=29.30 GHVQ01034230.1:124-1011(+)
MDFPKNGSTVCVAGGMFVNEAWSEETVKEFLKEWYTTLDNKSLDGMRKWLSEDASLIFSMACKDGQPHEQTWHGRQEIEKNAQNWFDFCGELKPTKYELVKYKFPMIIAKYQSQQEVGGDSYATELFILQGQKVSDITLILDTGSLPQYEAPPNVVKTVSDIEDALSNKDMASVAQYFSKDIMWMVKNRFNKTSHENLIKGLTRDGLFTTLGSNLFSLPILQEQIQIKLWIVSFQWPGLIVEGLVTSPAGSDTVIADVLAAYTMREVDGQITIERFAKALVWRNLTPDQVASKES